MRALLKISAVVSGAIGIALCLEASLPAAAQTPEERGLAIAVEADRRQSGFGDSTAAMTMVLRDSRGGEKTRQLRARVLEVPGDGDMSLAIFDSPADVRGTAILTRAHKTGDDDQWLYLPALKRVKRIAAANKSGPFMGSEFSYEDLANQEVEKYTYRWLRDEGCPSEELASSKCFVVESVPVGDDSGYSRLITWLDTGQYRAVRIDYYDRHDDLLKTLTLRDYEEHVEMQWRAHSMTMLNHVSGKSTDLIWSDYEFAVGLTENDFNPATLTRIR